MKEYIFIFFVTYIILIYVEFSIGQIADLGFETGILKGPHKKRIFFLC